MLRPGNDVISNWESLIWALGIVFVGERTRHVFEQCTTNDWLMDGITYTLCLLFVYVWVCVLCMCVCHQQKKTLIEKPNFRRSSMIRELIWLAVILMRCQNNIDDKWVNELPSFRYSIHGNWILIHFISKKKTNPNWIYLHNIVSYFNPTGLIVNLRLTLIIYFDEIEMHSFIILICSTLSETNDKSFVTIIFDWFENCELKIVHSNELMCQVSISNQTGILNI